MVRFLIIRHGYSKSNKEKKFTGQMDVGLDTVGFIQAEDTGQYVSEKYHIDKIYSSDLCRAYETAIPLAKRVNLPIITRTDLREADVGIWQGMLIEDVRKKYPEEFEKYRVNPGETPFPGGESYGDLMVRAEKALREIAMENEGKTVAIVTHGGVIRALWCAWNGDSVANIKNIHHVDNASVTEVEFENDSIKFIITGYSDHLTEKVTEEGVK